MKHNKTAQSWVEKTVQCTEKCSDQKLTNTFEVTVRGIVVRPPHIVTEVAGRLQDDQMSSVPCTCALLRKVEVTNAGVRKLGLAPHESACNDCRSLQSVCTIKGCSCFTFPEDL